MYDLEEISGRYKVTVEESWEYTKTHYPEEKLWYKQLLGKRGVISPFDEENLFVVVWSSEKIARKVSEIIGLDFEPSGNIDEYKFVFPVGLLKKVASLIKVEVKTQISTEHLEKIQEGRRKHQQKKEKNCAI